MRGCQGEHIFDASSCVKLICNNSGCGQSRFMHQDCFDAWQHLIINQLNKTREKKVRNWTERQKLQNLWKPQGYNLVIEACACKCGSGQLRKDLNWTPPQPSSSSGMRECRIVSVVMIQPLLGPNSGSESEKQKRRRKKSSKNSRPQLTIGLSTFHGLQTVKKSESQGIPNNRQRTNSMSSSNSGSSSWGSSGASPATSPPHDNKLPPRQISMRDRSR